MKKFTEIGQFREVIRAVRSNHDYQGKDENGDAIYGHMSPYPVLKFRGTVKNHGTNSAVCAYKSEDSDVLNFEFQSRERVLSLQQDNAGFMAFMLNKNYQKLFEGIEFKESCVIYGEWCGIGIQKTVAISQLPKMFIIFAVRIDEVYQDMENFKHLKIEEDRIFNILQFPTFSIDIDFNQPELHQNKLIEITAEIEKCCPVGKYFGIEGIGEGCVWEYLDDSLSRRYIFKVKGEEHAGKSKVKTLRPVDNEKQQKIHDVAEQVTPSWRLAQMLEQACDLMNGGEISRSKMGDYLRLVVNDVYKEDSDIIIEAGLEAKEINKYISEIARQYFFEREKENF